MVRKIKKTVRRKLKSIEWWKDEINKETKEKRKLQSIEIKFVTLVKRHDLNFIPKKIEVKKDRIILLE